MIVKGRTEAKDHIQSSLQNIFNSEISPITVNKASSMLSMYE